jgi:hypothetical protein
MFGYRRDSRRFNKSLKEKGMSAAAIGVVTMLGPNSGGIGHVELRAYNQVYAAIGVDRRRFSAWLAVNGPNGVGKNGEVLAPSFPVLSKVAWMYVDPIDLTMDEMRSLIGECERAAARTSDSEALRELLAVRTFVDDALTRSAPVRFGHP